MHLMIVHGFFLHLRRLFTDASLLAQMSAMALMLALAPVDALADSACLDLAIVALTPVTVADVSERAEVKLDDGRTIRLSGIAFFDEAQAVSAMRDILRESHISLPIVSRNADRWGRHSGQIAVTRDGRTSLLVELLVKQGVALLRLDDALSSGNGRRASSSLPTAACVTRLEAQEAEARSGRRGSWGGPNALPIDANDSQRLQQFEGRFVVVAGKVFSVGERQAMTFLNFGRSWRRDFSVMIAREEWDKMAGVGISAQSLNGKRVLVRGDLLVRESALGQQNMETGRAPLIRLSGARNFSIMDTD